MRWNVLNNIKDIKIDWLKKNHQMIHFFGLGFIQLKIDDTHRLHFYHNDLPPFVESPHNHRYDFLSKTFKGSITHKFYELTKGDDWICYDENCQKENKVDPNEFSTGVALIGQQTVSAGEEIFLEYKKFHTVEAKDCITFLSRSNYKQDLAQVLLNKNDQKVCPFEKVIPEKELWELVRSML